MRVVIAHGGNIGFPGGGTNRVSVFARSLAENGYEVDLVVPKPVGRVPEEIANSVALHTVPVKSRSVWDQMIRATFVCSKAKKMASENKAVLQIEHSTLGGVAASLGCSNYVLDVHDLEFNGSLYGSIPGLPKIIRYLERKAVSKASKIIVVSEPMREFIVKEWRISEQKIEVIPNGCFHEKLKKFNGNEEENGLISFIGVLTHNVDYEKVINLAETRRDTRIYMIGDGPMRYHLIKIVEEKGLNNINVPGYLPDEEAYGILSRSQVCVFPLRSTFHTSVAMHMKILDYAALGKAIATDRDATARIFEEHDAALVSDPANPQEFIENVQRLIDDMELRRRLGRNARRLVKDFTWQKQGEKLTKLYENLEVQG